MKLKAKMAWMIALSVVLAVILLVAMLYAFTALFVTGYNHVKLQETSRLLAERIEKANVGNEDQLTRELRQFGSQFEGIGIELYGNDGKLLYSSANRTEPYDFPEWMERFVDQPGRMFQGHDISFAYDFVAGGNRYYVVFDVKGSALQQVQVFLYFNQYSAWPFLLVPLFLIIFLPALFAFLFVLFVTRRLRGLNDAMLRADLRQDPVRLQDKSRDEIGALARLFNEMSDKLHRQYAHTRQVEQARTQLIGSLSHDLRTPLSIIQGYAETLQRGSAHDPDTRVRHSTIIVQKSEYMNRLLGQLFRLAKLDDPSTAFRMERGSIHNLMQSILAEYVLLLDDQGIEWQADMPEPHAYARFDEESLSQVFRNLIDNAILHGSDGKYLGIRIRTETDSVIIDFEDRGKGIPEEELAPIFERFYRGDKGRQSNGMGIGLSLANETVIRHGGSVAVRSVPASSTVFTVSLPLATE